MRKRKLLMKSLMLVSFALAVATMAAGNVDSWTAQAKAIRFLNDQTDMRFNASNAHLELTHAEQSQVNPQMNDFYVFNYDGGYVIVAGDDRAEEILGYGSGYFDMNKLPENVARWMDNYKEQMEYLLANPELQVQTSSQQKSGILTATTVPAMLTCTWDQASPYNKQCPFSGVTGPVATAMAQVMYFWKFPDELPALDAYEFIRVGNWYIDTLTVDALPGITLDWDNMRDSYTNGNYTTAQANAVAWLMRYCGQAVQTHYSSQISTANTEDACAAMKTFGYSDATVKYRNDYDATDWHAMMQAELEAGRPILYGGSAGADGSDAHTFVVDGYRTSDNKYHVNFGWGGYSNSYYALDAISADGYTFNKNQLMIIGVQPVIQEPEPEAYACYTPSNTTLTFYYDNQRDNREGTTYDLNTGTDDPAWYSDGINPSVTEVVFDPSFADARPTTTYYWMYSMTNLTTITGIGYLNTDEVTDMSFMFYSCNKLTSLNLSSFNTSNVAKMKSMFYGCSGLTSLDLSNFDTSKSTTMGGMFNGCSGLTSLDVSSFNTSHVTYMNQMFYGCSSLTSLDLSSFNTLFVAAMNGMFYNCNNLTTIYVRDGWSTENTLIHSGMFTGCTSLRGGMGTTYDANHVDKAYAHLDGGSSNPGYFSAVTEGYAVYTPENTTMTFYYDGQRYNRPGTIFDLNEGSNPAPWRTELGEYTSVMTHVVFDPSFADARPTSTVSWFADMTRLESITGLNYLNTSNVSLMTYMFYGCGMTTLDLSSFNTANVTDMYRMFSGCSNLSTIYVSDGWDTKAVTRSDYMFYGCTSLVGGQGTTYDADHIDAEYAHIDGGPGYPGYFTQKNEEEEAFVAYDPDNTTLTFFSGNRGASRSAVTYGLNEGSNEPEWLTGGISPHVTQVVFDPSFAEARPTTTYSWFLGMSKLVSITGMEYLNTDSVTNMALMFGNCRMMTSLDLSHFNTSNVTDVSSMFSNCFALTSLDLSSFNTDNVTNMECMFFSCKGLKSVDLSSFTNARVTRTSNMFEECTALTTIYASNNWSLPANNYSFAMFIECTSLVGGMGTTYDENHTDAAYARIDGGPSNPGYFTEKVDYLRGDVNGDGNVNIADVTMLIGMVLRGDTNPAEHPVADCNEDGNINIADVTMLIGRVLSGNWP